MFDVEFELAQLWIVGVLGLAVLKILSSTGPNNVTISVRCAGRGRSSDATGHYGPSSPIPERQPQPDTITRISKTGPATTSPARSLTTIAVLGVLVARAVPLCRIAVSHYLFTGCPLAMASIYAGCKTHIRIDAWRSESVISDTCILQVPGRPISRAGCYEFSEQMIH